MTKGHKIPPPAPMYAVALHNAAASGNLIEMKKALQEGEAHLKTYGNIDAALKLLQLEITKLEHPGDL